MKNIIVVVYLLIKIVYYYYFNIFQVGNNKILIYLFIFKFQNYVGFFFPEAIKKKSKIFLKRFLIPSNVHKID